MTELIEVLEHIEEEDFLAKRYPDSGELELKYGAQLTVRESQEAMFFRDGELLSVFGPGRHVLKSQNIPIITKWVTKYGYGPKSPFRAEVVFISRKLFTGLKWGTKTPIIYRDKDLGVVRIRSYGSMALRITNAEVFLSNVVGTRSSYRIKEIQEYLSSIVISKVTHTLSKNLTSVFDIQSDIETIARITRIDVGIETSVLGFELTDLFIESLTVPNELQKIIDEKSGMSAIGNLDDFMKYKLALSLGADGASNLGVTAGVGSGLGMGLGMMIPQILQGAFHEKEKSETSTKLKQLKDMADMGLINKDDYEKQKAVLLKQFLEE